MRVPETGLKGVFLVFRSLREHFRGFPDHFRGPEMNNRGAVELFRRLRKVSKGLKRVRKGSECIERVQKVFRGQKASFEDKKCHSKWPKPTSPGADPRALRRSFAPLGPTPPSLRMTQNLPLDPVALLEEERPVEPHQVV